MRRTILVSTVLLGFARLALAGATQGGPLGVPLPLFPAGNWWNTDISGAPVDPQSPAFINHIGVTRTLHPDFGGCVNTPCGVEIYGIPYVVVTGVVSGDKRKVLFDTPEESDGVDHTTETSVPFYPIPDAAKAGNHWIEGGEPGDQNNFGGDRHMLIVDKDQNFLYELFNLQWDGSQWTGGSGAFFDMNTNNRRPEGWTSADAAGLAILPGLVRYDEVYGAAPEIGHAFRVTVQNSNGHVYPGSHDAGTTSGALPMGARLRLKSTTDISGFPAEMQKIFRAMKKYGLIVADNGSNMYISGTFDTNWDNDILNPAFGALQASDFEVIQLGWQESVSVADATPVVEGDSGTVSTTFTVTLSPASTQTVTVHYATADGTATAGSDYLAKSGILTFNPGDTTKTVNVTVNGDTTYEGDETFTLNLSQAVNAPLGTAVGTATILNDDPEPSLSINNVSVLEGDAGTTSAGFAVTLSGPSSFTTTVHYATANGTATAGSDYIARSGVLTFAPGDTSQPIDVTVNGDTTYENDETFTTTLSQPVNATIAIAAGTATIQNDDPLPSLSINDVSLAEGDTGVKNAVLVVTLSAPSSLPTTVHYATADGTATTADSDYTAVSGTLTFAPGAMSKTINVPVKGDTNPELTETFSVGLSIPVNASLAKATGVGTILNDDGAGTFQFSRANYSVGEGTPAALITVTRVNGKQAGATVHYTTADGTAHQPGDYTTASATLTFAANQPSLTFKVPIVNDTIHEGNETVLLSLDSPSGFGAALGVQSTAVLTIVDNDAAPTIQFAAAKYSVPEKVGNAKLTVKRTGALPIPNVSVHYVITPGTATGGTDYSGTSGDLTFGTSGSAATTRTILIPITQDTLGEGPETFTVKLGSPTNGAVIGALDTATVTIVDDDATVGFSAPSYTVNEATSKATITVKRTGSLLGSFTVHYATSDGTATPPRYTATSGDLSFGPGVSVKTFPVAITNDFVDEGTGTVNLTLGTPFWSLGTGNIVGANPAVLSITDNEPTVQFSGPAYSTSEAIKSVTISVKRTGSLTGVATVHYATSDGTAVSTGPTPDYLPASGDLTFGTGQAAKTFPITLYSDTVADGPKTINLALSAAIGAAYGTPRTAVVTIKDDDKAGKVQFKSTDYSVNEGEGSVMITVTRTGGTSSEATVDYATAAGTGAPGTDYTTSAGVLTFGLKETTKTFTVPILDDGVANPGTIKNVLLTLSTPGNGLTLGSPSAATLWIIKE